MSNKRTGLPPVSIRTITLTGRPPVSIKEEDWKTIASASDKEFDNQYECQANRTSNWFVGVRQHVDGRTIVYATYSYSSNWQNSRSYSAKRGVLLEKPDEDAICSAIAEVCRDMSGAECDGEDNARWSTLSNECIADMPAEQL